MEKGFIKGEYIFNINIYTMFDVYNISIKHKNMILNQGLDYFLNRWISDTEDVLGKICIGTGTGAVIPTETRLQNPLTDNSNHIIYIIPEKIEIKANQLILTCKTSGELINNTTEIGVATNTNELLISRSVHPIYQMPTTATIQLDYIFTLNSATNTESDEMVEWE